MVKLDATTITTIIEWVLGIAAGLSVFIEISPIKINPWTTIFSFIGTKLNKNLDEKIQSLEQKVNVITTELTTLKDDSEKNIAINCRIRVLNFGDELRRDLKHSKENFNQVLEDIDTYEEYCKLHPNFKNSKTVVTEKIIKDAYKNRIIQNDFL